MTPHKSTSVEVLTFIEGWCKNPFGDTRVLHLIVTLFIFSSSADPYPIYEASGSYYEVGTQIGQQAAERISTFIAWIQIHKKWNH